MPKSAGLEQGNQLTQDAGDIPNTLSQKELQRKISDRKPPQKKPCQFEFKKRLAMLRMCDTIRPLII